VTAGLGPRAVERATASPERRGAHRRAQLGAYALWQLRDYVVDRGVPTLIVSLLLGYMTYDGIVNQVGEMFPNPIAQFGSRAAAQAAMKSWLNYAFVSSALGAFVFVAALFAMNGIVSNDRKLGYYRFLFAKPMSTSRYYGQAFVIHFAGFLVVTALLGAVYGVLVSPVLSWKLMGVVATIFLCYAGVAFGLSAAARWDWLSLVAVSVASEYLWSRHGASTSVLARLLYLLPPVPRFRDAVAAVAGQPSFVQGPAPAMPWNLLWWIAGYGAACFVVGLIVLRHRRLAIA